MSIEIIIIILRYFPAASLQIDYPMLFELNNSIAGRVTHCGVLEFIADEGLIFLPYWVPFVFPIIIGFLIV